MNKVALIGNPNAGKSSLFNQLTGLRQKTGNFPGVTVERKSGICKISQWENVRVIDLPGTYSIYPNSLDESVVLDVMTDRNHPDFPDLGVIVVDATNLKRNLLLFEQVSDLRIPCILALNMLDAANELGININTPLLQHRMDVPVVEINAREGIGMDGLKRAIQQGLEKKKIHKNEPIASPELKNKLDQIKNEYTIENDYLALLYLIQYPQLKFLNNKQIKFLENLNAGIDSNAILTKETIVRYHDIDQNLNDVLNIESQSNEKDTFTIKIDRILIHRFWGYIIFLGILFLVFQTVFNLSAIPMNFIDEGFASLNAMLKNLLPESKLTDLLTDGLLAGISGVIIFIPQIAFLFGFISILEESGYMARVVVLMDRIVRRFGLNGKSVVPLISGMACAVPAILSTRTIGDWKGRLITIFITPLMSCSARLPIYTILIAQLIPDKKILSLISLQGLFLMGLYLLGFLTALVSGYFLRKFLKSTNRSFFVMELPSYKSPRWKQVLFTIYDKVKTFVFQAGQIIVAISIILWVLASYGPDKSFEQTQSIVLQSFPGLTNEELEKKIASYKLENSYAGHFGKFIEPVIQPLGYDWKIGIALFTSFAAREVFVGTISTIYSIGSDDSSTIREKLNQEINPSTGKKVFSIATSASLLMFYAFAMMCMSTLVVVYRETRSWKWPLAQLVYMGALAYGSAWLIFNLLK